MRTKNLFLTGRPGSGKSSIIQKIVDVVSSQGLDICGVLCPEIRIGGKRVGFKIIELRTRQEDILAHVELTNGPRVGKYRVNLVGVEKIVRGAMSLIDGSDIIVIDEVGPMEVTSQAFRAFVLKSLDSTKPVLGAIHMRTQSGFIGGIKRRSDVLLLHVQPEKREEMFQRVLDIVKDMLDIKVR